MARSLSSPVHLHIFIMTTFVTFLAVAASCRSKCGNFTLDFPFSLSEGCALSKDFTLSCVPYNGTDYLLYDNNYEITNISNTQITIKATTIDMSCDTDYGIRGEWLTFSALARSLVLSSTSNVFMVVGCNRYGLLNANTRAGRVLVSCTTLCTDKNDIFNDKCSGVGCCQAPIPKGIQSYKGTLQNIAGNSSLRIDVGNSTIPTVNCTYYLVASKQSTINIRRAIDVDTPKFMMNDNLPTVYDWFIPNSTCRKYTHNKTGYVCKQNALCIDVQHELGVFGYRCKCISGLDGNPYTDHGCQDINECKGPSKLCSHICTNTKGSYICSCPKGYYSEGSMCFPNKMSLVLPIGLGVAFGTLLFVVSGYWILMFAKKRRVVMEKANHFKRNGGLLLEQQLSSTEGAIERARIFTQTELDKATAQFSEDRVLGHGGQGAVYKGMLRDGSVVAIKKSMTVGQNRVAEFINELVLLSQLNQRSIVKMLGCCLETETPILVYEFVPNGTLSRLLHDPSDDLELTWRMRLQIAIDVAGALFYLHTSSSTPILHRDVKSENILLDAKFRAKLSDFGISRSIGLDQSHITATVQGTFGYLDPECHETQHYTDKSDVYAFGVVLVELMTGQKALMPTEIFENRSLVWWFQGVMKDGKLFDVVDRHVAREGINQAITIVANIALSCFNKPSKRRPSMKDILFDLERIKFSEASTSASA